MPKLVYGVYQTPAEDTKRCVLDAIDVGYRSIDTAQAYYNESGVGDALAECGLPREEFFLTTKVWITNAGYEKAKASIEESLKKLRTDSSPFPAPERCRNHSKICSQRPYAAEFRPFRFHTYC